MARKINVVVACDVCGEDFEEGYDGSNSVKLEIYGQPYELDVCDDDISGTFLHGARPAGRKKKQAQGQEFTCPTCGKSFTTQKGLNRHKTAMHEDE